MNVSGSRVLTAVLVIGVTVSVACSSAGAGAGAGTTEPVDRSARPSPTASRLPHAPVWATGWPAGSLKPGMLLFDDGSKLMSVGLDGSRRVLWRHSHVNVTSISTSPGGTEMAYVVHTGTVGESHGPASTLWLLASDGSVRRIDAMTGDSWIESPVFVRAPTDFHGPVRLYWLRDSADFDVSTYRDPSRVMTLDGNGRPVPVTVPLRVGEYIYHLDAYPGAPTNTLTLFRRADVPSRYAVLRNDDFGDHPTSSSPTLWGYWEETANTDAASWVAWLTPRQYVIAVGHEESYPYLSIRLNRWGCDYKGSIPVYEGRRVDAGYAEAQWQMLALDDHRVLVIGNRDAARIAFSGAKSAPWYVLDVRDGSLTPTHARWYPDTGWTTVRPDWSISNQRVSDCGGGGWVWP